MSDDFWGEPEPLVLDQTFEPSVVVVHREYQRDPIGWAADKLFIPRHTLVWSEHKAYADHRWDGSVDPIASAMQAIADWKDVAIESATGTGKSFGVAVLILWFLACFENALVYTFALTEDQLKLYIWKNITELWPRFQQHFPAAQLTYLTIRMKGGIDDTWAAHGRAVQIRAGEQIATRAAGMHAEHMLLVYEEMAGMDPSVPEAGKYTCTAPHNLRIGIGNPNHIRDTLHRMTQEAGVVSFRASAFDHPNVVCKDPNIVPGATSQVKLDQRLADVDGNAEDPIYKSRSRGISPEQAANSLFRKEWLERSAARFALRMRPDSQNPIPGLVTGKGVDAANSEHGDSAAICDFAGNCVVRLDAFPCPDSNQLGADVVAQARRQGLANHRVAVDAIGVGAGTVNEARRLGFPVQALYAGGKPMKMVEKAEDGRVVEWSPDVNLHENLRSQMYWQLREDFRLDVIDAPRNDKWWDELLAHTFEDDNKVVKLVSKDVLRVALRRSPDLADASVMANWVRARAVKPVLPEEEQGVTLGYDYAKHRPRDRETADAMMQRLIGGRRDVTAGRFRIPTRTR